MTRRCARASGTLLALCLTVGHLSAEDHFTAGELEGFVSAGKRYQDRTEYLHSALKNNRIQLASAFAADGISKYVTFFTDKDVVSSLAADGNANLHTVTVEELGACPNNARSA